ncbi:hypothetical protein GBAR_LOCUS1523 [Geodia barretti]|uniref:Ig-like domain-containing protein n=1 Tax=Geodia barretti TaxID=519541 RepID=A0AA35QXS9_GEOBA|nr:hypothetical protein GBAR_LOCUS1523 [Geodia barretti]
MMPHYILFPSLESMRKVNLSCAIQPEALKENYRVSWRRVKPTPTSYSDNTFNITVTEMTEMSSIPSEYRCIVSIDHSSTIQDEDYNPPIVVVHKRVLSTLSGEIGDVSVATGEPATFVCNALKQDTSFSISWKVDSETFTCGASSENIPCYMNNETSSVLQIENTTALGVRSHVVECILQNVVPEEFRGDCVLLPRGSCDVTKSATLEISNGPTPPTVTSRQTSTLQPYKVGVIILSLIVLVQTGLLVGALVKIVLLTKKGSEKKTREERLEMDVNVASPKEIMALRTSKDSD